MPLQPTISLPNAALPWWLAAQKQTHLVYIAQEDTHLKQLQNLLEFVAPDLTVASFPAWDCLPYDRVSPKSDVVAERLATLAQLQTATPATLLTSAGAITQRVIPPQALRGHAMALQAGGKVDSNALQRFVVENGYNRVATVREPGEYAMRGGIIDLFPPSQEQPVRLDLFGAVLEKLSAFDPNTQLSTTPLTSINLLPAREILMSGDRISMFRSGYRDNFGTPSADDGLYHAVSDNRMPPGIEHLQPLFYSEMGTLFDYLPASATLVFDQQLPAAITARLQQVGDFYEARQRFNQQRQGEPYRALKPEQLYLKAKEVEKLLSGFTEIKLSTFSTAEQTGEIYQIGLSFATTRAQRGNNIWQAVHAQIDALQANGKAILIAAYSDGSRDRVLNLLRESNPYEVREIIPVDNWAAFNALRKTHPQTIAVAACPLEKGFIGPDYAVISEEDILGDKLTTSRSRKKSNQQFISELATLNPGDLIVHQEHGIGRLIKLETLKVDGAAHDCLLLEYSGGDKLYVPVENLDVLSRYGGEGSDGTLDKLGGASWQSRKAAVKKRLRDMAHELIKTAAARALTTAEPLIAPDNMYEQFCARFPYAETDDQLQAIAAVIQDLGSGTTTDRLVCGDVGFGKTEVALRAAFVAVMSGVQVAVVAPTTLLARQHFSVFKERFHGFPVKIGQLSRLVTPKDAKQYKEDLTNGQLDIVIGTHALLSASIKFKQLGLLIIDEEQRFGVKQKERLKQLQHNVHVVTLTATPIPRTLQQALSGMRQMSLITTPPVDRLAVRTFVLPFDPLTIREALMREHYRGGQSFFVCPRIEDLDAVRDRLTELVPELKVLTAHGQLPAAELEARMQAFYDGKYDVLLATNIIESGLDIPRANTMVMYRADLFGLAQLYQMRGRVGRGKQRGYAYLTWPENHRLTPTAQARLEVISSLDTLGAGFQLASHDMELRGGGNLLGEEQSGHIREVGVELFQQMLEEAVREAQSGMDTDKLLKEIGVAAGDWSPTINLGLPVLIPEYYVPDLPLRMQLYRRASNLHDVGESESFAAELIDRFGALPDEVSNLLAMVTLKRLCKQCNILRFDAGERGAVIALKDNTFPNPAALIGYIQKNPIAVRIRPDQKLVVARTWGNSQQRLKGARVILDELAGFAENADHKEPIKQSA